MARIPINRESISIVVITQQTWKQVEAGADRESDGFEEGAPLAVTGLSNLGKAWVFLNI